MLNLFSGLNSCPYAIQNALKSTVFVFFFALCHTNSDAQYCQPTVNCGASSCAITGLMVDNGYYNQSAPCSGSVQTYFNNPIFLSVLTDTISVGEVTSNCVNQRLYAWIDWNQDQIFGDDELIVGAPNTSAGGNPTFPITFSAADVTVGDQYYMRLRIQTATSIAVPPQACPGAGYYETEDYLIEIVDNVPGPTTYCDANGDCGTGSGINKVIVEGDQGGFTNNTGLADCNANGGYTDFSDDKIAFVTEGQTYQITTNTNSNGYFAGTYSIWVDWNNDFDFDDPGELIDEGPTSQNFTGTDNVAQMIPPNGVTGGLKRMRIRSASSTDLPLPSCGFVGLGEVEDYGLFVGQPLDCVGNESPANLSTNICLDNKTFTWDPLSEATGYHFILDEKVSGSWVNMITTDVSTNRYVAASNWTVNTEYRWKVVPFSATQEAFGCNWWTFYSNDTELPSLSDAIQNVSYCGSEQILLAPTVSDGSPGFTFHWLGDIQYLDRTDTAEARFGNAPLGLDTVAVFVSDEYGCTSQIIEYFFDQLPSPNYASFNWGDQSLCPGEDISVIINGISGSAKFEIENGGVWDPLTHVQTGESYSWDLSDGEAEIRAVIELGVCTDTIPASRFERFMEPPQPTIASTESDQDFAWCSDDGEVLFINNVQGDVVWSDGTEGLNLSPSTSGSYYATHKYGDGTCEIISEIVNVDISPSPEAVAIQVPTLEGCLGETISLSVVTSGDVVWSNSESGDAIEVGTSGLYWASISNQHFCTVNTDSVALTFYEKPDKIDIEAIGAIDKLCEGDSAVLVLTTEEYSDFEWTNGDQTSSTTVYSSGDYFVSVWNNGCEGRSNVISIDFKALPTAPGIDIESEDFCEGDSVLVFSTMYGVGLEWNTGSTQPEFYIFESGTFSATYTDPITTCSSTSETLSATLHENPERPDVFRTSGGVLKVNTHLDVEWFTDEGEYLGEGTTYDPQENDGYIAYVINEFGCRTASFPYYVENIVGVDQMDNSRFSIFPNPSKEQFEISGITEAVVVRILAANGQVVAQYQMDTQEHRVQHSLETGVYFVLISTANGVHHHRLVVD